MPLTTRARPCDSCRARKTRCVKPPDRHECVLCAFHGKQCTYLRGPLARPRPTSAAAAAGMNVNATGTVVGAGAGAGPGGGLAAPSPMSTPASTTSMPTNSLNSTLSNFSSLDLDLPDTPAYSAHSPEAHIVTSPDALMLSRDRHASFNFNSSNNNNNNNNNTTTSATSASSSHSTSSSNASTAAAADAFRDMVNLMSGTVGLDLNTHPEFIGPSSYHEPELLGLCRLDGNAGASNVSNEPSSSDKSTSSPSRSFVRLARRVDSRSTFLMYPDEATTSEPQRLVDCDAIEDAVRPAGKALVDLYFRIVHPCFPIIHKGVFLSKYAFSHRMFSPPLLAAVYLLALDYHLYAASLPGASGESLFSVSAERQAALEVLAERTMTDDLRRPKISTLQAGLLLLQRRKFGMGPTSALFTAQLVAVAQNIGLHVDCEDWAIPSWEKGLRRRLGAILYIQDRWGALVHGRPPLLHDDNWNLQPCALSDFPEVDEDLSSNVKKSTMAEGSINTDLGYEAFVQQTQLAHILSEIMAQFYSSAACRRGGTLDRMMAAPDTAMAAALPLLQKLRSWHAALPSTLALDCIQHRRLSANAPLHVARIAVEVALHRALLRLMTSDTPAAIVGQVRSMAREHVVTSLQVLSSLQPEHTGAFWSGVAAYQIVSIGSLIGLLWATTEDADEVEWCTNRMDALRWALRLRGRAAPFMQEALRLLETVAAPMGFEQQS
ncbi:transcription factor [Ophiostoma piceae UAMH 11346]|uniref:Transcription factor n=1 Tax=Ophiostoma piceae (strain UAMH 11346) TaxID=1262450 RepID=S3CD58_OPHP1|nr:transcription factor [Ophiostoma piceae UAMH 11346]